MTPNEIRDADRLDWLQNYRAKIEPRFGDSRWIGIFWDGIDVGGNTLREAIDKAMTITANPLPMPEGFDFHNASNQPCDMADGPCCCGAWHHLKDWPFNVRQLAIENRTGRHR